MAEGSILPSNSTPFERAAEATGQARFPALVESPLESLINPATIPLAFLPWLAWGLGVAIWSDSWSEDRQRWVVANAIAFARLKGTRAGFDAYLGIVDATIVTAVTPPGKTFPAPALTPDARADYLALFPELRVYPYVAGVENKYSTFTSAAYGFSNAFLTRMFPAHPQATERYTRTSEIVDNGVVTPLTRRTVAPEAVGSISATTYDEIKLPAIPSTKIFPGQPPKANLLFGGPFDPSSIIRVPVTTTWSFTEPRVSIQTAQPGLPLMEVAPDDVAVPHTKMSGQLFPSGGAFFNAAFTPASVAWQYTYQRWYLFDPSRVPPLRHASTFLGWTRLGQGAYTAELQVAVDRTIGNGEAWQFVRGCLRAPQQGKDQIGDILAAVRLSRSARDEILIKTRTVRPAQVSDEMAIGDFSVGGWVPDSP